MSEKKNFLLNCGVCDTRKMKEEDYSSYEKMMINADIVIVNETSKSILNRLALTMNQDKMIEAADDVNISLKTVNGSYEITGTTMAEEHTILMINGPLHIHPDTQEILKKYEHIMVNGSVKYPKSLEGHLNNLSVNGSISTYPDDCVILDKKFILDKYFPLRAKENAKYYAEKYVAIQDKDVDVLKLLQKNVQFVTKRLIVPESKIEDCVPLFDEQTKFMVVPEGMQLILGDVTLDEGFLLKNGNKFFVYGNVKLDKNADAETLCETIESLVVKGTLTLLKEQEEAFLKASTEYNKVNYDKLKVIKNTRNMCNMVKAKLDKSLFDNSPEGITVSNVASVVLAKDITPEMILEKLTIKNCAHVICDETQESAVTSVAENVAKIGNSEEGGLTGNIFRAFKDLTSTKLINADSYIL